MGEGDQWPFMPYGVYPVGCGWRDDGVTFSFVFWGGDFGGAGGCRISFRSLFGRRLVTVVWARGPIERESGSARGFMTALENAWRGSGRKTGGFLEYAMAGAGA